jgi:hypothetical protein
VIDILHFLWGVKIRIVDFFGAALGELTLVLKFEMPVFVVISGMLGGGWLFYLGRPDACYG